MRLALLTVVVVAAPSLFAQTTPRASTAPPPKSPSASRPVAATVAPELQHPIERLKAAIESRSPSKMEEVYSNYEQDDPTKKYFERTLANADSVYVKSIVFHNSNRVGNVAQVNYRMIIGLTAKGSMIPTEASSSWRADLVRAGAKEPGQIRRLTRRPIAQR